MEIRLAVSALEKRGIIMAKNESSLRVIQGEEMT